MNFIKEKSDIIAIQELYIEREKIIKEKKDEFRSSLFSEMSIQKDTGDSLLKESSVSGKNADFEILFDIDDNNKLIDLYKKRKNIAKDNNKIKCLYSIKINEGSEPLFSGIVLMEDDKKIEHAIQDKYKEGGINLFVSAWWMSWEYITLNGNKIFFNDFSNSSESALNLINENFEYNQTDIREIAKDLLRSFNDQYEMLIQKLS